MRSQGLGGRFFLRKKNAPLALFFTEKKYPRQFRVGRGHEHGGGSLSKTLHPKAWPLLPSHCFHFRASPAMISPPLPQQLPKAVAAGQADMPKQPTPAPTTAPQPRPQPGSSSSSSSSSRNSKGTRLSTPPVSPTLRDPSPLKQQPQQHVVEHSRVKVHPQPQVEQAAPLLLRSPERANSPGAAVPCDGSVAVARVPGHAHSSVLAPKGAAAVTPTPAPALGLHRRPLAAAAAVISCSRAEASADHSAPLPWVA